MRIETSRLTISEFTPDMAESIHLNSLDEDTRRFLPDEVFETIQEAADTISFLSECRRSGSGPQVCPVLLKDSVCIGYVQAVPMENGRWEIGYHIGARYTKKGYATEAVRAFLPAIMNQLGIQKILGICRSDNLASLKVLTRCGFIQEFEGTARYQGTERRICRFIYTLPPALPGEEETQ